MSVWLGFVGWVAAAFTAGAVGSMFPPDAWYQRLRKPAWNPPGRVFPVAWSALYALMGVAAFLVWKRAGFSGATAALVVFVAQLALNAAWPWLFFGRHRPGLALVDVAVLWLAVLATTLLFLGVHWLPAALLLPYLAWVAFAAALNFSVWRLNRG